MTGIAAAASSSAAAVNQFGFYDTTVSASNCHQRGSGSDSDFCDYCEWTDDGGDDCAGDCAGDCGCDCDRDYEWVGYCGRRYGWRTSVYAREEGHACSADRTRHCVVGSIPLLTGSSAGEGTH